METLIFIGFMVFYIWSAANKAKQQEAAKREQEAKKPLPDYSRQFEGEEGWNNTNTAGKKYVFGDIEPVEPPKPVKTTKKSSLDDVIRQLELEMQTLTKETQPKPKPKPQPKRPTPPKDAIPQSIDYNSREGRGSFEGRTSLAGFSHKEQELNKVFKPEMLDVAVSTNNDYDANREKNKEILSELRDNPDGWRKAMIYSVVFGPPKVKNRGRVY